MPRRQVRASSRAERMWALKRLGDPAITPDGQLAVLPVTSYDMPENKGLTDLWLVPLAGGPARQLTSDKANDTQPTVSPGRRLDCFRFAARRRHREPGLRDCDEWRRGASRHQSAHRRVGAEMVSGQQAHRLRERSVAGPGSLGRPGGAQEGTRVIEDECTRLDARADLAFRSLPRRPSAAPVLHFHRRRRAHRDHAHVGLLADARRSRCLRLRHLARRPRGRVRSRRGQDRRRPQLRHHSAAHLRLQTVAQHHGRQQGR